MTRATRVLLATAALAAFSFGAPASAVIIGPDAETQATVFLPPGLRLPTWCFELLPGVGIYVHTKLTRYGCASSEGLEHDWVLLGFPGGDEDDNEPVPDGFGNSRDICPLMEETRGPHGHGERGCPWAYASILRTVSTLDYDDFDKDIDGVLDWFDACEGDQGTPKTLGCDADKPPPEGLCEAMKHQKEVIFMTVFGELYASEYYVFHEKTDPRPQRLWPVYGMGRKAKDLIVKACLENAWPTGEEQENNNGAALLEY